MNKIVIFMIAVCSMQFSYAQNDQIEEAANYAADYICGCVNKVYDEVDDEVRQVLIGMAGMTQAEIDDYFMTLDPDLLERVGAQAAYLESEENVNEMNACNERMVQNLEKKYPDAANDMGVTETEVMLLIMERMESREKCDFAYFLILMAMSVEDDTNTVIEEKPEKGSNSGGNYGGGGTDGQ